MEKDNVIELYFDGSYKDGGSESYRDKDDNKYWRDFSIESKGTSNYGKLYLGQVNKKDRILAKGNFKLIKKPIIRYIKKITELSQY